MTTLNDFKMLKQSDELISIFRAIMTMDSNELSILFDDNIDYEDIGKEKFIDKLKEHFNKHKIYADSEFYLDFDFCNGCNCEMPICKFIGNNSKLHFALFFEITQDNIADIYHCNWYGNNSFTNPF
jgi:hypothetical protein